MSTLPRSCLGCGVTIPSGSRCPRCQAQVNWQHDQRKGTRQSRGYDAQWDKLSRAAIARQPYCSDCGHWGDNANPLTGDHLRWPARTVDDVVCRRCNSKRGARRGRLANAFANRSDQGTAGTPISAEIRVTHA